MEARAQQWELFEIGERSKGQWSAFGNDIRATQPWSSARRIIDSPVQSVVLVEMLLHETPWDVEVGALRDERKIRVSDCVATIALSYSYLPKH